MNQVRFNSTRSTQLMRGGFTLTEMLVAVGAMALLALGVAQVFSLTTRTVAAGRRLSNLNAVASATERQMRADFASLTSRGVMVIRNEEANNGNNVDGYAADPEPRRRRIDEIIFSASGQFTSGQQPIDATGNPVHSSEAMIYYGHGARQDPLAAGASGFNNPVNITGNNAAGPALGVNPGPGGSKVNQYASEWVLVRRAFVLTPPATQNPRIIPPNQGFAAAYTYDTATEIAGLPAVASPNRADAGAWQSFSTFSPTLRGVYPTLASGVVDIVAMDLRSVATQLAQVSSTTGTTFGDSYMMGPTASQMRVGPTFQTFQVQQMWMRGLLPADSDNGRRIRVETTVPDFLNMNGGATTAFQRSDQLMLTSGAFLPRCSEFIVEYSFGAAHTAAIGPNADIGAIYWHGLDRKTGVGSDANDYGQHVVRYADWVRLPGGRALVQAVRRRDPESLPATPPASNSPVRVVPVQPALIEPNAVAAYEPGSGNWSSGGSSSYAFFGLNDPTYSPIQTAPGTTLLARDVNGDGNYNWADGDILQEPESMPWPRPTMLRITFTLSDPTDPSVEQTFQFIFDLAKDVRGAAM
jgi:prepilin-type N-terminal cleavage/methylation domain-containing protein